MTERNECGEGATVAPILIAGDVKTMLPSGRSGTESLAQAGWMQELEDERQRIAMDLHDGMGPLITLIKLELHNARILMSQPRSDLALAHAAIRRAEDNVTRTLEELRRAVRDLRPAILDDPEIAAQDNPVLHSTTAAPLRPKITVYDRRTGYRDP